MREKLIKLLGEVQYLGGLEEKIADHLIANGVTIPVRCKDCAKAVRHEIFPNSCRCKVEDFKFPHKKTHFCSYGERKDK